MSGPRKAAFTAYTELCPACLGRFRVFAGGTLVRHGFNARFPYGRDAGGYQVGGCVGAGEQHLGTAKGNAYAIDLARHQDHTVEHLEGLPPHTTEQATEEAVKAGRESLLRPRHYAAVTTSANPKRYETPADFANTSVRGWFYHDAIDYRRRQLDQRRREEIASRRDFAKRLREAVAANPVKEA